jgi:putative tryptophan/tyrosine transport system substrate-binding protein
MMLALMCGSEMRLQATIGLRIAVLVVLLTGAGFAEAQQAERLPRVAFLAASIPSLISDRTAAFRQGLRELGYVEGKNIAVEYRWADGQLDRLPELANELVRQKFDIIVSAGPAVTRPTRQATATIPIVMAFDHDPVGAGFVASLARPGGNVTGLAVLAPEISAKQLELLKEAVPGLVRVAVLGASSEPGYAEVLKATQLAAQALRLQIDVLNVSRPEDFETAIQAAKTGRADALLVLTFPLTTFHRARIAELAIKSRLPAIHAPMDAAPSAAFMTFGPSITESFRRAATYVDKILKGAKPADLPVEQPTKFELVINLKTARQIGLTIPPNVLARADKVTE